jgi:hypothetical protein
MHIARWTALSLLVVAVGCASRVAEQRAPRPKPTGPTLAKLLLLPVNLALPAHSDFRSATGRVGTTLERFLRERSVRFSRIEEPSAQRTWRACVANARAAGAEDAELIGDALQMFAHTLVGQGVAFDALVAPGLLYRPVEVYGSRARWDGVDRPLALVGPRRTTEEVPLEGGFTGISLHVLVFSKFGDPVFEGIGGIDLAHIAELPRLGDEYVLKLRDDLLDDEAMIEQGTRIALGPYLERLERSGELRE